MIVVFATLVGSFLVATVIAQRMSARVATLSDSLTDTAMPRIEQVAALRDATLEVQFAVAELVHRTGEDRPTARAVLDARLANYRAQVRGDLAGGPLTFSPDVSNALHGFESAVERTRAVAERDPAAARVLFQSDLLPAANRLGDRAMQHIERTARHGRELARELKQTRGRVIWLSYGLVALCSVVAGVGVVAWRRKSAKRIAAVGAYARDQEARARDQESKAREMEEFAGRVAHDIRAPLATASLAAEMLDEQSASPESKTLVARLQRSLSRTASIIDGLLAFARAGAHPEPGARANVREVIHDIADGIGPELERSGIELDVEPPPSVLVRCSSGVLASVIGNLMRNAIKYMDQRAPRRISVRALEHGDAIRVEVRDTGPGIAEALLPRLFDPYFRVSGNTQPGLGLGLPTVRKLAEGHGGRVGVSSVVGAGSTFWFELPHAGAAPSHDDVPPPPSLEVH